MVNWQVCESVRVAFPEIRRVWRRIWGCHLGLLEEGAGNGGNRQFWRPSPQHDAAGQAWSAQREACTKIPARCGRLCAWIPSCELQTRSIMTSTPVFHSFLSFFILLTDSTSIFIATLTRCVLHSKTGVAHTHRNVAFWVPDLLWWVSSSVHLPFLTLHFCRSYASVLFTLRPTLLKPNMHWSIGDASRRSFAHVPDVEDVFSFMYEQRTTSTSLDSSINILSARYRRVLSRSTISSRFQGRIATFFALVSLDEIHYSQLFQNGWVAGARHVSLEQLATVWNRRRVETVKGNAGPCWARKLPKQCLKLKVIFFLSLFLWFTIALVQDFYLKVQTLFSHWRKHNVAQESGCIYFPRSLFRCFQNIHCRNQNAWQPKPTSMWKFEMA